MEFFNLLVKIHREGEGAPFEGIKPAGSVEPEIALADKAVATGSLDDILSKIHSSRNKEILSHLFHKLREKSNYQTNDVSAGREYIEAYVVFIHSVEKALQGQPLVETELHNY